MPKPDAPKAADIVRFPSTPAEAMAVAEYLLAECGSIIIGQPPDAKHLFKPGVSTVSRLFTIPVKGRFEVIARATPEQWVEQYGIIARRFKLKRPGLGPPVGAHFFKVEVEVEGEGT